MATIELLSALQGKLSDEQAVCLNRLCSMLSVYMYYRELAFKKETLILETEIEIIERANEKT